MQEKIVIVIPAYNEGNRIVDVLKHTTTLYDKIILVDDASTDNTAQLAEAFCSKVIALEKNSGAGFATKIGCDYAFSKLNADIVVTIDGDGQHAPEDIHLLVNLLLETKLDIVFGYRLRKKNMHIVKRIGNYFLSKLSRLLFEVNLTDTLTGFHAFTQNAYPQLRWESNRYGFVSEYVYRVSLNQLKYGEVAVQTIYNDKDTGMSILDGLQSILLMFTWRFKILKSLFKLKG